MNEESYVLTLEKKIAKTNLRIDLLLRRIIKLEELVIPKVDHIGSGFDDPGACRLTKEEIDKMIAEAHNSS